MNASGVQVNIGEVRVWASILKACVSGVEAVASGVQVNISDFGWGLVALERVFLVSKLLLVVFRQA